MDIGLRQRYIEDETIALNLRMFTALAFVPPDDIMSVFQELKENTPEEAQDMIPYMERTYVGTCAYTTHSKPDGTMVFRKVQQPPLFPPHIWSVYGRTQADEPRTNNHLEGWHHRFQTVLVKHHPNVFEFIERLRGEQARTETRIEQLFAGAAPTNVCKKVKTVNEKIARIVEEYQIRQPLDYLRGLAYNIRY